MMDIPTGNFVFSAKNNPNSKMNVDSVSESEISGNAKRARAESDCLGRNDVVANEKHVGSGGSYGKKFGTEAESRGMGKNFKASSTAKAKNASLIAAPIASTSSGSRFEILREEEGVFLSATESQVNTQAEAEVQNRESGVLIDVTNQNCAQSNVGPKISSQRSKKISKKGKKTVALVGPLEVNHKDSEVLDNAAALRQLHREVSKFNGKNSDIREDESLLSDRTSAAPKLKLLNKPAVKSIKSEDGDIIDCVDINKQPAFDHPALRNHKIQSAILVTEGQYYSGAQGDINVWNPTVDLPDDYTTAQIWLKAGTGEIYKDAYKTTGCFNITCPGFVQTNPKLALGIHLDPVSSSGGPQYFLPIGIYQDPNTGNWWLKILQNYEVVVGYWPKELFAYLWRSASLVEWGGEVYSQNVKEHPPHTKTQMGSGSFPQTLKGYAARIKNVRIMVTTLKLKYPEWVDIGSDEQDCYSALNDVPGNNVEPVFCFGGPGQGPQSN
ncbi:hypothetical protein EZV62_027861 [Acer yangbiense]|uniref:Neprosin PEP catalytic domain-containing protein n=1 Tax=Acer yangbiense TaxID=1000413 RepID=A0A5C7GQ55_9ROSI|nr:hypothetical protein EZV62_027861 [Acer yangbiense]